MLERDKGTARNEDTVSSQPHQVYDEVSLGSRRNGERQLDIVHEGAVMCLLDCPLLNFCLVPWTDLKQIPAIWKFPIAMNGEFFTLVTVKKDLK